jgi:hypothetical protein
MFMIHTLQLLNKSYAMFCFYIIWMSKIFVNKDMMVLVICVEWNGLQAKFLE